MKKTEGTAKKRRMSIQLLCSYLIIILAPAIAVFVIYLTMQEALLDTQKEKALNLSRETAVTLNKEMEQLENVARYIVTDGSLKKYLHQQSGKDHSHDFYQAYELAKSYPDYAILNRLIKKIYIMPFETSYLIQIPRVVVPNNKLGMTIMDLDGETVTYEEMVENLYDLGKDGMVYDKDRGESGEFQVVQRFNYSGYGEKAGVVVIELEKRELKSLLAQSLGSDAGVAFLADENGNILYVYDSVHDIYDTFPFEKAWEEYLGESGWSMEELSVHQASVQVNHWSVIAVIPRQELLSKVGNGKYVTLILCILSILIGIAICLWYWNKGQPLVDKYVQYTEKYPQNSSSQKKSENLWKSFGGVLEQVDSLQLSLDKQKQRLLEGVVRKILYGIYDSPQELEQELVEAELSFPIGFPCILAGLEIETPMNQEPELSVRELEAAIREELDKCLSYPYLMIGMGSLHYILLLYIGNEPAEGKELKQFFEEINYAVYSRIPVNMFIGISGRADTVLAIAEEYEHVCRICEYARYYKLRMPCLLEDLPRHQHVVFTVELEIQLERTIKNGTKEQLLTLLAQVRENYFYIRGADTPAGYNLEVLRCILLRCLGEQKVDAGQQGILEEVHGVRSPMEMEETIWHVWQYYEDRRISCQGQDLERVKQKIEGYIEQGYSQAEFNLASMADWMGIQEKKLYADFKKMYGISFASFLEMKRLHHAQEFLKEGRPVGEVAQAVGYSSDYSFRRAFKRVVGVTPSDYQKMQENSR